MGKIAQILVFVFVAAIAAIVVVGYAGNRESVTFHVATGGQVKHGRLVILQKNCGSCHTIPGITGAQGVVGPPLYFFSRRTFIAGELPNTPENLALWVRSPQSVNPKTAMPDLGLSEQEAKDVAAYLYTLR
jgi:cytochrome c1